VGKGTRLIIDTVCLDLPNYMYIIRNIRYKHGGHIVRRVSIS